jgi:hypothetical protein
MRFPDSGKFPDLFHSPKIKIEILRIGNLGKESGTLSCHDCPILTLVPCTINYFDKIAENFPMLFTIISTLSWCSSVVVAGRAEEEGVSGYYRQERQLHQVHERGCGDHHLHARGTAQGASAVGCLLPAISCLLPAACCLLAAGCWLLVVGCWLLAASCWLLSVACCLLSAACCLLSVVCHLLCLLSAACCLLPTAC